ncbi:hypothetical protein [Clostridium sp. CCUG 7971]|uniref:hypothetical protein n=1 Tax=Clostridium sp. CCUG 7971 TaxID=2811414 RepID=UPI001ABAA210|nr:hypothetical protein [Clostridium sp. CCUG 7971]MBO3445697.1 hypothetical protein [Clostridium sp. CCUG 7971]
MKKILIGGMVILSLGVVGCASNGYQADERNMDKGVEVFERENLDYESINDYFYSMHGVFSDMENSEPNEVIFESHYAKDNKQNDDMLYGILNENIRVLDKFPSMTCDEMVKEFYMDDAPKEDMLEFQKKVTPIIKDMSSILKEIVSNPEFDGTISKEQSDRIGELMFDEYKVYYDNYFSKSYNE